MVKSDKITAIFLVPIIVFIVFLSVLTLGLIITVFFGLPSSFNFSLPTRLFGVLLIGSTLGFLNWLFVFRKPNDVIVSTYLTCVKAIKRIDLEKLSGRTEGLILLGPYRYVRHPLYFSVCLLLLGCWVLLDYTFMFIGVLILFIWFKFVVIPFEEKELVAIFGEQYEIYMKEVPSIIPFSKKIEII